MGSDGGAHGEAHGGAPLFAVGEVSVSASALDLLTRAGVPPRALIGRHASGDFGLAAGAAARENRLSARMGYRVLSRYAVGTGGGQVWVMTEKTRAKTFVFDPREYGVGA